ncbi:hypothetical protein BDA99DRAFT_598094 [Phascolomyces articulosus]|uniref:Uncharacterized protein n=1 Tax=Phascolomyces articulosus TaxID=60185 RepID=A0AAD5PFZ4_9FUNG|nr:hypothetical protein BDA99DRAFT_598094 [Phascolomyces articulosus]
MSFTLSSRKSSRFRIVHLTKDLKAAKEGEKVVDNQDQNCKDITMKEDEGKGKQPTSKDKGEQMVSQHIKGKKNPRNRETQELESPLKHGAKKSSRGFGIYASSQEKVTRKTVVKKGDSKEAEKKQEELKSQIQSFSKNITKLRKGCAKLELERADAGLVFRGGRKLNKWDSEAYHSLQEVQLRARSIESLMLITKSVSLLIFDLNYTYLD